MPAVSHSILSSCVHTQHAAIMCHTHKQVGKHTGLSQHTVHARPPSKPKPACLLLNECYSMLDVMMIMHVHSFAVHHPSHAEEDGDAQLV